MPLDPSIILQGVNAADVAAKTQGQLAQQQATQQQLQLQRYGVAQAKQDFEDQQNWKTAYRQAGGDFDKAIAIGSKIGLSAKMMQSLQMQNLQVQNQMATLHKTKVDTDKTALDVQTTKNTQLADLLAPVANGPTDVPTFSANLQNALRNGVNRGLLTDQEAQQYAGIGPEQAKSAYTQLMGWQSAAKAFKDKAEGDKAVNETGIATQKQANESGGQVAETIIKQRAAIAPTLEQAYKAGGPDAYAKELAKQDPQGNLGFPADLSKANPQAAIQGIRGLSTTADQKAGEEQAAANSARESQALAQRTAHENALLGLAQQTNAREAQKYSMEFGGDAVKGWTEQLKQNPSAIEDIPANLRTAVSQEFGKQTGAPLPTKLGQADKTLVNTARYTQGIVQDLRQAVQTPEIQSILGPISGRLAKGESIAGAGLTQNQQAFVTKLEYLFAGEGKAVFGGRAPEKLMEGLKAVSASPSKGLPELLGSLDATNSVAQQRIDNTIAGQFGGRLPAYYKQQQSGGTPSPSPAPAPATKVPPVGYTEQGYKFKGGDPANQSNWEKVK